MPATLTVHRNQVQTASGLNFLVGIWLFISAFVVCVRGPMVTNNVIFGVIVTVLALIRISGAYTQSWLSWLNALAGIWVIISPWAVLGAGALGPSQSIIICNCITGAAVLILGCWSAISTDTEPLNRAEIIRH